MISPLYSSGPKVEENNFFRPHPRVQHLKKLYFMLFLQQSISLALSIFTLYDMDFVDFLLSYKKIIFPLAILFILMIIILAFFCRTPFSQFPLNYFVYLIFTASLAFFDAYFITFDSSYSFLMIVVACWFTVLSLWVYSLTTKCEFTYQGATLFLLASVMLVMEGFLLYSSVRLDIVLLIVLAQLIWGYYLVYDTQTVVSGVKYDWNKDDYVLGAIGVYIDIIVLFLRLCELIKNLIVKERN